ncbi:uncharacterized protein LOC112051008 isoform X13 [Bicyclus anynana]|uniref:Uncharacterized protein LOC112051008 isoform X13 n=1 Tax=Bicyclus anynana TaxID=110368 RepID=A0ABM3M5P9_BICAN|nr:uncharacterized protein LOC112051008 isoform X13 [Bicyclus anynana]
MPKCSFKKCKNHSSQTLKKDGVSYFRFPRDPRRRKKWTSIMATERSEELFKPNHSSVICSKHFLERDVYVTTKGIKRLNNTALPQIEKNDQEYIYVSIEDKSSGETLNDNCSLQPGKTVNTYKSSEALPYSDEDTDSDGLIDDPEGEDMNSYLVFNDRRQETSPEGEPSTSTRYQTSRFVVEDEAENEEEEVEQIIIKEEVSEEEKNQCRLCLSVNRRMWELGENAPLYRKLLFETNQNSTMPSFIYEMLACWECHAELRKIRRFQDKVRRANSAFETSQNLNCQELSNLGTVLITEEQPSNSELQEDMIKQEPLDIEETAVPDPLDVNRAPKEEIIIEVPRRKFTPKTTKRTSTTKTSQNTPKRTKIDPNTQEDPQTDAPVDCDEIFCKVKIELEELQSILEGRRNKDSFKNMKYKCDSCVLGFTDYSRLQEHNASFHDEETGICSCDICERRFTDERLLATHTRNHFVKFVCRLCPFECYTKTGRMIHFRRHKEAVQSDDPDSVLRQKLSSMESTGESSHDLD